MRLLRTVFAAALLAVVLFFTLPSSNASAVDLCNPGEIYCMPSVQVQLKDYDECGAGASQGPLSVFSGRSCASGTDDDWTLPTKQDVYIPIVSDVMVRLTEYAQLDAQLMLQVILVDQLSGHNVSLSPVLVCADAQNEQQAACANDSSWFLGQYMLMRQVSLYVMIPLFFLMVIQSIIKGSLYNLLRHSLVMLPLAIIGTVVIIVFMQMMLNITDDMCNYIVDRATTGLVVDTCTNSAGQTVTSTTCGLKSSLAERSLGSSGLFASFAWFIVLIGACVAVYLELVGRQIGVYMMSLMLPLVMAGLVWSRSVGIAKKVFQYELALIISKLFIVAAISLGMGAYAATSTSTCSTQDGQPTVCGDTNNADGTTSSTNGGMQALASGTLIMLLAAFAGAKVVTLSPAALAGTAPVWNKGVIASRGQGVAVFGQRLIQLAEYRLKQRKPGGNFNTGTASAGGPPPPGASTIPPPVTPPGGGPTAPPPPLPGTLAIEGPKGPKGPNGKPRSPEVLDATMGEDGKFAVNLDDKDGRGKSGLAVRTEAAGKEGDKLSPITNAANRFAEGMERFSESNIGKALDMDKDADSRRKKRKKNQRMGDELPIYEGQRSEEVMSNANQKKYGSLARTDGSHYQGG